MGAAWAASPRGGVCAWRGETERFWFSFRVKPRRNVVPNANKSPGNGAAAPGLFLIVFPWLGPGSKGTEPPRLGTTLPGPCPPVSPHFGALGTAVASHGTPGHSARGEDTATAFKVLGRRGREVLAAPPLALPLVTRAGRVAGVSGAFAGPARVGPGGPLSMPWSRGAAAAVLPPAPGDSFPSRWEPQAQHRTPGGGPRRLRGGLRGGCDGTGGHRALSRSP